MSIDTQVVYEDSAFSVLARIHANGTNVVQADVSTITYSIYPTDSDTAHTTATSLTVATVIYDTLQTDARWSRDITGYNWRHDVAATVLVDPTKDYQIEYKVTMADASVFHWLPDPISLIAIKTS